MIKIIGTLMVFLSCALMGFELSARLKKRTDTLKEIKSILEIILRDVSFLKTPVYEIFTNAGRKRKSGAGELFLSLGERLLKNPDLKESVTEDELNKKRSSLCLSKSDIAVLLDILNSLGTGDSLCQKNMLSSGILSIESLISESEENLKKNEKTYKSSGVLLGIFIVVLFV